VIEWLKLLTFDHKSNTTTPNVHVMCSDFQKPYPRLVPHVCPVSSSKLVSYDIQTWGQLLSNVIDYITITLQFS
jgi:hypothetical protein